jgi:TRAP-type C4-dicarboxylate transport system substrate-binding protein
VVNKEVWDSWKLEDRRIVREAAIEAGRWNIEAAREGMTGANPAVVKQIEGLGVKVVRPSAQEIAAFKKVTKPVYDKWSKQIGPDLVKKAEASIARRNK